MWEIEKAPLSGGYFLGHLSDCVWLSNSRAEIVSVSVIVRVIQVGDLCAVFLAVVGVIRTVRVNVVRVIHWISLSLFCCTYSLACESENTQGNSTIASMIF